MTGLAAISLRYEPAPRRKTLAIVVRRDQVIVRVPSWARQRDAEQFVAQKHAWIEKTLARFSTQPERMTRQFESGESLHFLGELLRLRVIENSRTRVERQANDLVLYIPAKANTVKGRRFALAAWYCQQARDYCGVRVAYWAQQMQVQPRQLRYRYYKSRWGLCNSRAELSFNWLIMMASPADIDYVVVHELAHLRHFNHSVAFWHTVARFLPDYKNSVAWFKQQQHVYW